MRAEMASAETADHTHLHTQIHTNTRLMDDTSIRSRMEALCPGADERSGDDLQLQQSDVFIVAL